MNDSPKRLGKGFLSTIRVNENPDLLGQVSINGEETHCLFSSEQSFSFQSNVIHGHLEDGRSISLLNCIPLLATTRNRGTDEGKSWGDYKQKFFPNLITLGNGFIDRDNTKILSVDFDVTDLDSIFYDFGITGMVWPAKEALKTLRRTGALRHHKLTDFKKDSFLHFGTGKRQIFQVNTIIGKLSAQHVPEFTFLTGPNQYRYLNHPKMRIVFNEEVLIWEAINRIGVVREFLQIIASTPQYIRSINMECKNKGKKTFHAEVYDPNTPDPETTPKAEVHPGDVLIRGAAQPSYFCNVMENWIKRSEPRRLSRHMFARCHEMHNRYDYNRLVEAANCFDVLPKEDTGTAAAFSKEARDLTSDFRRKIKSLSSQKEKEIIRSRIAYLLSKDLKSKIAHRASIVESKLSPRLDGLTDVTRLAVGARNYFSHGSASKTKKEKIRDKYSMLTEALEFVYAISELIECGWDPIPWLRDGISYSRFGILACEFNNFRRELDITVT